MTALQTEARRVVDDLIANGADPRYRPEIAGAPPSFTYELSAGGDRQRCRQIIADAKWRPALWAAILEEIAARSQGAQHD